MGDTNTGTVVRFESRGRAAQKAIACLRKGGGREMLILEELVAGLQKREGG